ncbi:ABC transporter substrate-binding protein [Nocardia sp. CDC160]|uniref:ABC transporter substrate-binding protein n=1 Tax=Nocardia sp. CDC160 TaxID=3112166 RepID=UPI002DB8D092|nr:ABC transporter substrate-binding protein [Nocardia sp. CDC160]MEC3917759.1 ABC transporter substrate-binding protein [Nocardia sp. CDC160]
MASRRTILRAGALLPLAAACTPFGAGESADAVKIAVPWGGAELQAFEAILTNLRKSGQFSHRTVVTTLGDDVGTVFAAGRFAPDIVVVPQIGQIPRLAADNRLHALDEKLWSDDAKKPRYADGWWPLVHVEAKGNRLYGLPFKATCKSLIWYDRTRFTRLNLAPPDRWPPWLWPALMTRLARSGVHPLALGGADGWMLTDFFANVLLAESRDTYESVANPNDWRPDQRRAELTRALRTLASIWGFDGAFPGNIGRALTQQFPDAVRAVFGTGSAAMVVAPDFAEPIVRGCFGGDDVRMAETVGVSLFPSNLPPFGKGPMIGGGDVLVATRSASAKALELIGLLSGPELLTDWISAGGFIAPDLRVQPGYSPLLDTTLNLSGPRIRAWSEFDLADRIGSRGGDNPLWRVITAFLTDLDDPAKRESVAVAHAVDAIYELEHGRRG